MDKAKLFNASQIELLRKCNLNPSEWVMVWENQNHFRILHKETGKKVTIDKKRRSDLYG